MRQIEFIIEGMHCGKCASKVQNFVQEVSGVIGTQVSLEQKLLSVEYDASGKQEKHLIAKVMESVQDLGYEIRRKV
ncbi:hypothetical protein BKN38_01585 [Helicobacter sp. CLO-3]|uniref:heavy-metal-associated domain-containing protein n=1 Tax=unclassified Helicobacter TaxID=2593540 RepID=UPI00080532CF|nr:MULTISPECIES: heavy-metal-associated domain-containing protein [unclassified Helicobacter]OBV29793.1 hypothetical protein BA723_00385 [Helicobacter sp. CLO-3]OHU85247.1 hypothetical protein BKN38_01585 [Helicobacter sp. CLO-3]